MSRQESSNEALEQVMQQQKRMHALKRERINLSQEQKKLNVERQKRITEYKRLQTLRKIKADEEKVRNIEREKARMLQKRKAAAIQVKVQKDQIAKGLEALRLTKQWDKAGALLTNITSKKKGKKKGKKKKKGSASMPNLRNKSNSLPAIPDPGPMPADVRKRAMKAEQNKPTPQPYTSPYDAPLGEEKLGNGPTGKTVPAFASIQGQKGLVTFWRLGLRVVRVRISLKFKTSFLRVVTHNLQPLFIV